MNQVREQIRLDRECDNEKAVRRDEALAVYLSVVAEPISEDKNLSAALHEARGLLGRTAVDFATDVKLYGERKALREVAGALSTRQAECDKLERELAAFDAATLVALDALMIPRPTTVGEIEQIEVKARGIVVKRGLPPDLTPGRVPQLLMRVVPVGRTGDSESGKLAAQLRDAKMRVDDARLAATHAAELDRHFAALGAASAELVTA